MIRRYHNLFNLGLRPDGRCELIDPVTSLPIFMNFDPGGDPVDIILTLDTPFKDRDRSFLTSLREQRAASLQTSRKEKKARSKLTTQGETNDASTDARPRRKRSQKTKTVDTKAQSFLSGLDPSIAANLLGLFKNLPTKSS